MSTKTTDLAPIVIRGEEYADHGYCRTPYGSMHADGPVIHTVYCEKDPRDTATSSSTCIRPDQDGAAIKAARDAADDERRFTPPAYRTGRASQPGPVIDLAGTGLPLEVVALRGRPLGADGKGTGEWTTWETFTETDPGFDGIWWDEYRHQIPATMTPKQAKKIIDEFTTRVPGYEFTIVRATVAVTEKTIA